MATTTTSMLSPVEAAHFVLKRIPPDSTWEQVMYHLWVRQKIEQSLKEAEEGEYIDHDELFAELLAEGDEDEA